MGKLKRALQKVNGWFKGSSVGNGKVNFTDFLTLDGRKAWQFWKNDVFKMGRSEGDQAVPEQDMTGLQISDAFGDDIRDMQQAAAQQQMAYQTQSAKEAMQFSADEAQKNRDWQEKMSNSAYTRAVSDLKNAGLNPVLAVGSNMGASTPAGSSAVGIAQSGSQAAVSEYNSALAVMEVLLSGVSDIISSAKGLGTKRFKVGF